MTEKAPSPPLDPVRFRAIFLLILVAGVSILFFGMIRQFLVALFLGAIASGLIYPAYKVLQRWFGGRKTLAATVTLVLFLLLCLGPVAGFLGIVANQALQVTNAAGPWIDEMRVRMSEPGAVEQLLESLPGGEHLIPYQGRLIEKAGELAATVGGFVAQGLTGVAAATVRLIFLLFVMLYAMFFFLKEGRALLGKVSYCMPLTDQDEQRLLDQFTSVTRAMAKGTLLIGILQGGLAGFAFWAVGIPSAAFWGTCMVVLSIIPGIGSGIVWFPAVVYLLVTDQAAAGIGLAVWCGGVVGTLDNFLRPWLVGRDVQMPDLMILLGTLGGLFMFGMAGILIGPVIAALFITVWELYGEHFRQVLPESSLAAGMGDDTHP